MSKSQRLIQKTVAIACVTIILLIVTNSGNIPPVHGFTPDDPEGNPWHLDEINIHSVWDHGYSFHSPEAIGLCIVGYPITDDQNGDLNMTETASFAWDSSLSSYLPYPSSSANSHEGACASVAASTINNGIGVAGIVNCPLYSAWPWGSYPEDDVTYYHTYVQQMIDIFEWGSSFGRMVFTMSFLDTVYLLESDDVVLVELQDLVTNLYESEDALFFAAVDNTLYPLHPRDIPTSLPYTRAIGRIDSAGSYVEGGYGDQLLLIAPAGGVPAYMQSTGTYGTFGGSSCATPIAAASAVLLWNQFPWATNGQIEDALVWGASDMLDSGWDEKSGFGSLDVEKSREYLVTYVPSANSYRLDWTNFNSSSTTTETPTTTTTTTTNTSSPPDDISSMIPLLGGITIGGISVAVVAIFLTRRRTRIPQSV